MAQTKEKFRLRLQEEIVSLIIIRKPSVSWSEAINKLLDQEEKFRLHFAASRFLQTNKHGDEVTMGSLP